MGEEGKKREEFVSGLTEQELNRQPDYMTPAWRTEGEEGAGEGAASGELKPAGVAGVFPPVRSGTRDLYGLVGDSMNLSPEEEQRRIRRARTAAMIGNLGNVMSGFANLYYVDKGAPAMQLPEAVVPDYMTFVDRVNGARRAALANQMARERLNQTAAYQRESLELRRQQEERMSARAELEERKQSWKEQYEQGRLDILAERNRIDEMYKRGQIERWERDSAIRSLDAATRSRNADTAAHREERLAGGSTVEESVGYDERGRVKTRVTTPNGGVASGKPRPAGGNDGSNGNGGGNGVNKNKKQTKVRL